MCLADPPLREVLAAVAELAGCPVLLEDATRWAVGIEGRAAGLTMAAAGSVLSAGAEAGPGLPRWEIASNGRVLGRLCLVTQGAPSAFQVALVEHAAAILALSGAVGATRGRRDRSPRLGLISELVDGGEFRELIAKAAILGVDLDADGYLAMAVDAPGTAPFPAGADRAVSRAAGSAGTSGW